MKVESASAIPAKFAVERRRDGVLIVRVPSCSAKGADLPDAVFTFRVGDPQYEYWAAQWTRSQQSARPLSAEATATE